MSYKCEIVADSINSNNNRLTTFLITYPRIIHSELMTHRVFSRNSASSRAIPFEKMVKMVEDDPFIPIAWQKDHKGMQGTEYWTDDDTVTVDEGDEYERYTKIYSATEHFITEWLEARDLAIAQSYELNRLGVTKQLCNRLLEPFMWHTVLVTATSYENFFELRCPKYEIYAGPEDIPEYFCSGRSWKEFMKSNNGLAGDFNTENIVERLQYSKSGAEIHIQALAEAMWDAMNESKPKELKAGEYHIPFGDRLDEGKLTIQVLDEYHNTLKGAKELLTEAALKVATARCARLSYMTFDGEIDYEKDIQLHDRLLSDGHMSPFEHCARAMNDDEYDSFIKGKLLIEDQGEGFKLIVDNPDNLGWCNNFRGFIQYRHIIENK